MKSKYLKGVIPRTSLAGVIPKYLRYLLLVIILIALIISTISCTVSSIGVKAPGIVKNNKILLLLKTTASAESLASTLYTTLTNWGYAVTIFENAQYYSMARNGTNWYLHDNGRGKGDLNLVVDGVMQYSTIIFGADGDSSGSVETSNRLLKSMFTSYSFLGITQMESTYCYGGSTNNVWQVGYGDPATQNLVISNPTGNSALGPLVGYTGSFTTTQNVNITAETGSVTNLEIFDSGTPAITMASYKSGAKAIYFAFTDWGYSQHVSMLVRLIQEYSGSPYKKPYYSYEVDDCGPSSVANEDYTNLVDWVHTNLGGYPTLAFTGEYLDQSPPPRIIVYGQNPTLHANNTDTNNNLPRLIKQLKSYPEYVIAAHGYQHDRDLWEYTATGLPVNGFGDDDKDGVLNWQDDTMLGKDGDTLNNNSDPDLKLFSGDEFADYDLAEQEIHLARLRTVFDSFGLSKYKTLIIPKFVYLDGYSNTLFAKHDFTIISGLASEAGYTTTPGYVNGTYVPIRVEPSDSPTDPSITLNASQLLKYKLNFLGFVGEKPIILITSHIPQMQTPYNGRNSALPAYKIMNAAGFTLLTTQSAANKNIGWLWTTLTSTINSSGDTNLTLTSSAFADGATKHELDMVMPSNIKDIIVGSNYWIDFDGSNLYYGKSSGTTENLTVESGSYNSSIPRIISISTPATDVLDATYNPATQKISLSLKGDFDTKIGITNLKAGSYYRVYDATTSKLIGYYLADASHNINFTVSLDSEHDYEIEQFNMPTETTRKSNVKPGQ